MSIASVSCLHLFSRCNKSLSDQLKTYRVACDNGTGDGLELAMLENDENFNSAIQECEINVAVPVELQEDEGRNGVVDYEGLLKVGFALNWRTWNYTKCEQSEGHCGISPITYGSEDTTCKPSRKKNLKILLGTALSAGGVVLLVSSGVLLWEEV